MKLAGIRRERGWFARLGSRQGPNHVSLGTFCHGAAALREAGLRHWSGPFDWIFSTPALVAECLADDFAGLLDPRHLVSIPEGELPQGAQRQCRHVLYEPRYGLPTLFNHHDPAASNADRRRFQRAIGRLRAALRSRRANVFYLVSEVAWPDGEIAELARALAAYPSDNTLVMVTLKAGEERSEPGWADMTAAPGCRRLDVAVATRSRSRGIRFADPADDAHLARVLTEIAARLDSTSNGHI